MHGRKRPRAVLEARRRGSEDYLLDTALMHPTMWAKARWEFAAELRPRAAKFGATPEDGLRLRLTVQTPGEQPKEQPAGPPDLAAHVGTYTSLGDR